MTKLVSTSQLAKQNGLLAKDLFEAFRAEGYIVRQNDEWSLTAKGKTAFGAYKESQKYGRYIVWPENLAIPMNVGSHQAVSDENAKLSATALGEHFKIPARQINTILSELGWARKHLKGWHVTELGRRIGGWQRENSKTGIPYVTWTKDILVNENLVKTVNEVTGVGVVVVPEDDTQPESNVSEFRSTVPKQRTADGHYVRSRAEMLIDNWLYMAEIVHAYERRLPVSEEVYCDFYLPAGKVYIEFWGMESDPKYAARKEQKKSIYEKYGLNLVELNDDDIINLDDVLPKLLLKHGITTY